MIESAGSKKNIDPALLEKAVGRKELTLQFLEKFPVFDEQVDRARTFILDILHKRPEHEIHDMKVKFESKAYYAEDRRRITMMDPERFAIEQPFVEVTRELIQL